MVYQIYCGRTAGRACVRGPAGGFKEPTGEHWPLSTVPSNSLRKGPWVVALDQPNLLERRRQSPSATIRFLLPCFIGCMTLLLLLRCCAGSFGFSAVTGSTGAGGRRRTTRANWPRSLSPQRTARDALSSRVAVQGGRPQCAMPLLILFLPFPQGRGHSQFLPNHEHPELRDVVSRSGARRATAG